MPVKGSSVVGQDIGPTASTSPEARHHLHAAAIFVSAHGNTAAPVLTFPSLKLGETGSGSPEWSAGVSSTSIMSNVVDSVVSVMVGVCVCVREGSRL